MTKLPRRSLQMKTKEKILDNLTVFINSLENRNETEAFSSFFLSRTERLVLAKRLQIAILLLQGHNYQAIGEILDTSANTISKINNILMAQPEITKIINKIFIAPEKEAKRQQAIDKKLRDSLPFKTPTLGKNLTRAIFGDK